MVKRREVSRSKSLSAKRPSKAGDLRAKPRTSTRSGRTGRLSNKNATVASNDVDKNDLTDIEIEAAMPATRSSLNVSKTNQNVSIFKRTLSADAWGSMQQQPREEEKPTKNASWLSPKRSSRLERALSFRAFSKKLVGSNKSLAMEGLGGGGHDSFNFSVDMLSDSDKDSNGSNGNNKSKGVETAGTSAPRASLYTSSPSHRSLMADPLAPRQGLYTSSPTKRGLALDEDDDGQDPSDLSSPAGLYPRASLSSLSSPVREPYHQRPSDVASIAINSFYHHGDDDDDSYAPTTAADAVEIRLRELQHQHKGSARMGLLRSSSMKRVTSIGSSSQSNNSSLSPKPTTLRRNHSGASIKRTSLDDLRPPNLYRATSASSNGAAPRKRPTLDLFLGGCNQDDDDEALTRASDHDDAVVENMLAGLGTVKRDSGRAKHTDEEAGLSPRNSNHSRRGLSSHSSNHSTNASDDDRDGNDCSSNDEEYDNFVLRTSIRSSRTRNSTHSNQEWRNNTKDFFRDEYQDIMKDIVVRQEDEAAATLNDMPNLDCTVGAPKSRRASLQGVHDSFLMFSRKQADWNNVDQSVNLMDASSIANLDYDHTAESFGKSYRRSSIHQFQSPYQKETMLQKCQRRVTASCPITVTTACHRDPRKRNFVLLLSLLLIGMACTAYTVIPMIASDIKNKKEHGATLPPLSRVEQFQSVLVGVSTPERLQNETSPANQAFQWLLEEDPAQLEPDDVEVPARFALATMHFGTQNEAWTRNGHWMSEASVCHWYGVECEGSMVTHLNLTNNHIWGDFPIEFQALSELRVLDLSKNLQLKGSLSADLFTAWSQMEYLLLQENRFGGRLPEEIGALTRLTQLSLWGNELSGPIAPTLNKLTNMRALMLQDNSFISTIPDLSSLQELAYLHLDVNKLTSTIPSWIGKLTQLRDLRVHQNSLTGTIPKELANAQNLGVFFAGDNRLAGSIPEIFQDLPELSDLQLHRNIFRSSLPTSIQYLTNLRRFTIDHCGMTGTLPPAWQALSKLQVLAINHNNLVGPLPTTYGNMRSLRDLWVNHNFLQEAIPSELGKLTDSLVRLYLESNAFHSTVPAELGNLDKLEQFRVFETLVTGTMPHAVCDLVNQDDNKLEQIQADCEKVVCDCCTTCF
ncbi:LRR receptor-like serine threonine-protein kinase At4g08850-like [Seminavis robusta]|uniref:LRR receptor-like serine threonine-protein kinase At4g08850-like n=1 Tax=Seminavis robusta TaxID=568900 RepID=A0A9N8EEV9_9STRA|nr:LRR receptor-like serine threonine-protein kinase At4g08850-like [Seminavis robusta]|eukprot:Sro1080_g238990.1 LRR receptor-like serine threonine-protein kinase At4g08850-like (1141) ;mRNA; r:19241-23266